MSHLKHAAIPALIISAFSLNAAADNTLAPVVVTATRQPMRADELLSDVTVVGREDIERAGGTSVIDVLGKQPGIQVMQNGGPGTSAEIYLRGTRANQVKILVDGMPINSADITGSPLRYLSLADIDRIEILRGPASSLYGADAVGGVIQIITQRGKEGLRGNAYAGFGSFGTQKLEAGVSGGEDRWRYRLAGSDFRTDGISAIRNATGPGDKDHDPYRSMGFNGSLDFTPATGHELSATWAHNHGQVFFDGGSGVGNFNSRIDFLNQSWNVASKDKFTEAWTSTLRYGQSLDDQTTYTSSPVGSTLNTQSSLVSWQNDIKLPLGTMLALTERTQQKVGPASRFPTNADISNNAVLLGWNARLAAHSWQVSNRKDQHSTFGDKNTWSAAYGYRITDTLQAKMAAGTSFRAPTPYQLYAASFGNAALQPEQGRNKEVGFNWEDQGQSVDFTWYRNDLTNLIDYSFTTSRYQNISQATLEGTTLTWGSRIGDWRTTTTVDTLDAKNTMTHQPLERRAKGTLHFAVSRDWGLWSTSAELVAVDRRYSTTSTSGLATLPMGGYTLLNFSARYAIAPDWTLELNANNVTDKQYATARVSTGKFDYNAPGANYFVGLRYQMK